MDDPARRSPARTRILTRDEDVLDRVREVVGAAARPQLWFLLEDLAHRLLPRLTCYDVPPRAPGPQDRASIGSAMCDARRGAGAMRVILVLERPGSRKLSALDRDWLDAAHEGGHDHGVPLRGVLLAWDAGVRWLGPDDLT